MKIILYHINHEEILNRLDGSVRNKDAEKPYRDLTFGFNADKQLKGFTSLMRINPESYKKTLDIETDNIDGIFKMTNNIDESWVDILPENANYYGDKDGCKSTSVGDLLILDDGKSKKIKMYSALGFTEFSPELTEKVLTLFDLNEIVIEHNIKNNKTKKQKLGK